MTPCRTTQRKALIDGCRSTFRISIRPFLIHIQRSPTSVAMSLTPDTLTTEFERTHAALKSYILRITANKQDAEDIVQETWICAHRSLENFKGESTVKTWLFAIAQNIARDHLRSLKRWPEDVGDICKEAAMGDQEFFREAMTIRHTSPQGQFEIREHIAFCFTCIARSLEPEAQAALVVREVLGFSNEESAAILGVSEPVFRHRLSGARRHMAESYEGLCALINKQGVCHQCKGLREWTGEANRGADLVEIQVAPGKALTVDNLLDARIAIARASDLEEGKSAPMHRAFYKDIERRESQR